jgi:hypothetical protein
MATKQVAWKAVDQPVAGLATNAPHQVQVQREAIPIIFIPGVMGSRLRLAGTGATPGAKTGGLPNMRWDPGSKTAMLGNYLRASPAERKALLIGHGKGFDPNYLEVDNDNPPGNGYRGLLEDYHPFLDQLRSHDWGALGKLFVFPVHAFGYNWTASNRIAGAKLEQRIGEIIDESRKVTGICEKVILVTHSMGGLVARSAMKLSGAEGRVLGVVHGVQPAYGAVAAYTRIKGGFEGGFLDATSRCLGPTGRDVTALLANSVGGLQLLPGRQYQTSKGSRRWLRIPDQPSGSHFLPLRDDPFNDIYRVPAIVAPDDGSGPTHNTYWGLVDPALLTPEATAAKHKPGSLDEELAGARTNDIAWTGYLANLAEAESLLTDLGSYRHPRTWWFNGDGLDTPETAAFELGANWVRTDSYPKNGFRGFLRDAHGSKQQAVLQGPDGKGDGTVPRMSSSFNASVAPSPTPPANSSFNQLAHQPAYQDAAVQAWATAAVTAIAGLHFKEQHG